MSWTLFTSGSAIRKATNSMSGSGIVNANATLLQDWADETENYLCTLTRNNLISNYSTLTTNGKQILGQIGTNMLAMKIIGYQMEKAPTRAHAETVLDILENENRKIESLIQEDKHKTFLGIT